MLCNRLIHCMCWSLVTSVIYNDTKKSGLILEFTRIGPTYFRVIKAAGFSASTHLRSCHCAWQLPLLTRSIRISTFAVGLVDYMCKDVRMSHMGNVTAQTGDGLAAYTSEVCAGPVYRSLQPSCFFVFFRKVPSITQHLRSHRRT